MDKQKQIQTEELIGIIQGAVGGCATHWASLIAEEVLKYYQPKIPDGAVVLTDKKDIQQYEWSKLIDKMGVIEFGEKIRKETAEKFAERAKEVLGSRFNYIDSLIKSKIDEIAKEITKGGGNQ